MDVDERTPVGEIVARDIRHAQYLDRLGIDYCCHGGVSLGQACQRLGLEVDQVVAELADADARPTEEEGPDFTAMGLGELADHIEAVHHAPMRRELPRLEALHARVTGAHGDRHPELFELGRTLALLRREVDEHFMKEERVLFPMVRRLEAAGSLRELQIGGVSSPIPVMEHEHETVGAALGRMRELTGGYTPPSDGCTSYDALLTGLADLEYDLHRHIHKENNILFPRAVARERELQSTAAVAGMRS